VPLVAAPAVEAHGAGAAAPGPGEAGRGGAAAVVEARAVVIVVVVVVVVVVVAPAPALLRPVAAAAVVLVRVAPLLCGHTKTQPPLVIGGAEASSASLEAAAFGYHSVRRDAPHVRTWRRLPEPDSTSFFRRATSSPRTLTFFCAVLSSMAIVLVSSSTALVRPPRGWLIPQLAGR
jgi:hypothetical protein